MPIPSTATLIYTAQVNGPTTPNTAKAVMAAAKLPTGDLANIGAYLTGDVTTINPGPEVERMLTFSIAPHFNPLALPSSLAADVPGSVVSSDPRDSFPSGVGAQVVALTAQKIKGEQFRSLIEMNGTTPVNNVPNYFGGFNLLANTLSIPQVGSLGAQAGYITLMSGPNGTGFPVFALPAQFTGSIFSTSPADAAGGVGAQTVTVSYNDSLGNPHVETIALNGTTPVNFVNSNKQTITNIIVATEGAFGANAGIITLMTGLNGTGAPISRIDPSFFQYFPFGTDQTIPFRGIYTQILATALASQITESPPALA
jgi:hypothetical protein